MVSCPTSSSHPIFERPGVEIRRELRSAHLRFLECATTTRVDLSRHRHDTAQVLFLVRGKMGCSCPQTRYVPLRGVYHPPGVEHRVHLDRAVVVILTLDADWLQRLRGHAPPPARTLVLELDTRWISTRLVNELRQLRPASLLVIEGLVAQLLASAARTSAAKSKSPPWLAPLLERLHADFGCNLSVHSLAAEFRLHPDHLTRVFRRRTGRSVGDYLFGLRVAFLEDWLKRSAEPLVELALAAGFADQSHCNREFKRRTGLTPAAYRRLHRPDVAGEAAPGSAALEAPAETREPWASRSVSNT